MMGGTAITRKQGSSSVNRISRLVSALCRHQVFVLGPWAIYELSLMTALVYSTQKTRVYSIPARLVRHAHHIIFQMTGANYGRNHMKSKASRQRPGGFRKAQVEPGWQP